MKTGISANCEVLRSVCTRRSVARSNGAVAAHQEAERDGDDDREGEADGGALQADADVLDEEPGADHVAPAPPARG